MKNAILTRFIGLAILLVALPALAAQPAEQPRAEQPRAEQPRAFVERLHKRLHALVAAEKRLAVLQTSIGDELARHFDYPYMAERVLGTQTWSALKKDRKEQFLALLEKMLRRTYVRRFKPGHKISVTYARKVRGGKAGRVQVRTEIQVERTRAEVWYSLRSAIAADGKDASWRIYDIVVDEASQLRTYRRSFRRVLQKDGWDSLIKRMKKSAGRA